MGSYISPVTAWGPQVPPTQAEPGGAEFVHPGAEALVTSWVVLWKRDYGVSWRHTGDQQQTQLTAGEILAR